MWRAIPEWYASIPGGPTPPHTLADALAPPRVEGAEGSNVLAIPVEEIEFDIHSNEESIPQEDGINISGVEVFERGADKRPH